MLAQVLFVKPGTRNEMGSTVSSISLIERNCISPDVIGYEVLYTSLTPVRDACGSFTAVSRAVVGVWVRRRFGSQDSGSQDSVQADAQPSHLDHHQPHERQVEA